MRPQCVGFGEPCSQPATHGGGGKLLWCCACFAKVEAHNEAAFARIEARVNERAPAWE